MRSKQRRPQQKPKHKGERIVFCCSPLLWFLGGLALLLPADTTIAFSSSSSSFMLKRRAVAVAAHQKSVAAFLGRDLSRRSGSNNSYRQSHYHHHGRKSTTTALLPSSPWGGGVIPNNRNNAAGYHPPLVRLFATKEEDDTTTMTNDDDDNHHHHYNEEEEDTIFALSSGMSSTNQATGVAVIRISGPHALSAIQRLVSPKNQERLERQITRSDGNDDSLLFLKPRYATLCKLYHPTTQQPLDHSLVVYFPKPNSFTGEDVVEIHCHGSRAVVPSLLDVLGTSSSIAASQQHRKKTSFASCRLAEPGEFTQRAYANGKLDVLQVEALADLLTADTSRQRELALRQLDGALSKTYRSWRDTLISGLAHAEAIIDFGDDEGVSLDDDYDDDEYDDCGDYDNTSVGRRSTPQNQNNNNDNVWGGVVDKMNGLRSAMERQLYDARRGQMIREGIRIAIVGPPNAGKSSLFNVLAQRDAAIVSQIAGTTRDVLETTLNLRGMKCIVSDTAGIRNATDDFIEKEGMKRAYGVAQEADIVVAVLDGSNSNNKDEEIQILWDVVLGNNNNDDSHDDDDNAEATIKPENVLLVWNKADLGKNQDQATDGDRNGRMVSEQQKQKIGGVFEISCVTQEGMDAFLETLTRTVLSRVDGGSDMPQQEQENVAEAAEGIVITRARHRQHVEAAAEALERFHGLATAPQQEAYMDMAAEELRLAASELGRITGAVDVEDVLDVLFNDFCIGK